MTKNDYYRYFAQCKPYIKFSAFCKECGISPAAFSKFLKGETFFYEISIEKLQQLYNAISGFGQKIA